MMNRDSHKMLFLALCLMALLPLNLLAQSISETEARQRAQAFLQERNGGKLKAIKTAHKGRRMKGPQATPTCDYYIFNAEADGGFVIVSGDDRTIPILGYSDSGSIQDGSMPEGLKVLLEDYSEQIAGLEDSDVPAQDVRRAAPARHTIAPLIETKWNQGAPYNKYCPEINSERTVTGCVATSMAQVMYYYKFPSEACRPIPGYTMATTELKLDGLEETTFNWNAMTTTYSSTATGEAADAVAELMQYCGWAVQMSYGTGGSSTYNETIPDALKTYFSYDNGVHFARRTSYTYPEWVDLIYSELAAARPVMLGGLSVGSGHSFICDGYDDDDYFHINWGWGGSSDGYFRLAVLDPYVQGVGGSSTLDGFNFAQTAIVGIQPSTPDTRDYCLSLEDLYMADYPTSSGLVYTLNYYNYYLPVNLNYTLCSYKYGTNNYDIAFMLVDDWNDSAPYRLDGIQNKPMTFIINFNGSISLSIPVYGLNDGTYYIKVMSRPHSSDNSGPWMECFDGKQKMIKVVRSGNKLTINVPRPTNTTPADASITVEGNKMVGYEQNVIASITGGSGAYHGSVILRANGTPVMGKEVDIPAGKTVNATFSFIPQTSGDNELTLWTSTTGGDQIGSSTTVTILESDASNTQELIIEPTITNLSEGKLYGNAVHATVRVKNTSTTNSYVGRVSCSLRMYNNATDAAGDFFDSNLLHEYPVIPKSESEENLSYVDLNFDFESLNPSKFYRLRFSYYNTLEEYYIANGPIVSGADGNAMEMGLGYKQYAADGSMSLYPLFGSTLNASSSTCVDLREISSFDGITITPSTNPNCIYLLPTGLETPSALSSCNVVSGSSEDNLTASTLILQDGHDFFTPVPFTADAVSYTRTFTLAANGTSGWNTIMLPFDVCSINCAEIGSVDWFHSSNETGKNFWVRAFTADGPGTVIFDYANEMEANTPYIIAVPDNRWGSAWQMTERTVTFMGTNALIEPTSENSFGGNAFKFSGSTKGESLKDVYLLNGEGSSFVLTSTPTNVPAFRAWFSPVQLSSLTSPALSIGSPKTTGISLISLMKKKREDAWFDLSGRKLHGAPTKSGLYINNSKTIIKK